MGLKKANFIVLVLHHSCASDAGQFLCMCTNHVQQHILVHQAVVCVYNKEGFQVENPGRCNDSNTFQFPEKDALCRHSSPRAAARLSAQCADPHALFVHMCS